MKNYFTPLKQFLFDAIFPQFCLRCHKIGGILCDSCQASLPFEPQRPYPRIFSATSYLHEEIQALIHHWKFQHCEDLTPILGALLLRAVHHFQNFFLPQRLLIPVPLHRRRERIRGFHQTLGLAEVLHHQLHWPLSATALIKTRPTRPQMEASASERHRNVADSFRLLLPLPSIPILLIDDVVTTGSTLNACMDTLSRAGYLNILALTLASQPLSPQTKKGGIIGSYLKKSFF